ncbi:hypothetical protein C4D60_Mb11t10730 [Musa balbisiana]|uniref:Uncharacterized protein n=1 Tax=Musa balbisiana TaxID=52838 RepID=A0A4S8J360_MUSBA|nr:hypothetical protein C4D60_Mb11t10730 [Musa balbisiana]
MGGSTAQLSWEIELLGGATVGQEIWALLGFVNFKLYHSINVKYPPILDPRLEALAAELCALCCYISTGSGGFSGNPEAITYHEDGKPEVKKADKGTEESELRLAQLQHQLPANEPAFGAVVSWEGDGSPFKESYDVITHQAAAKKLSVTNARLENQDLDDPQTLLVEGIIDRTEANEAAEKKRKLMMLEKQYHDELNMELQGITYSTSLSNKKLESSVNNVKEDTVTNVEKSEDPLKVSMSRKKRKLYEAMKSSETELGRYHRLSGAVLPPSLTRRLSLGGATA